jgi:CRP-like cAMP-binding protein
MSERTVNLAKMPAVFPWAAVLSAAEQKQVETEATVRAVGAGEFIGRAGVSIDEWTGVMSGLVKLCAGNRRGRMTTHLALATGGWWGDASLQRGEPRSGYDAVALRDSRLVCIPRATFLRLQRSNLGFNHYLLRLMAERTFYFFSLLESDRLHAPTMRVARCLAAMFNPWLQPGIGSQIQISQEEIGNLVGVSRQRVNEALRYLRHRGLLEVTYRGIRIADVKRLQRYCDGGIAPARRTQTRCGIAGSVGSASV